MCYEVGTQFDADEVTGQELQGDAGELESPGAVSDWHSSINPPQYPLVGVTNRQGTVAYLTGKRMRLVG